MKYLLLLAILIYTLIQGTKSFSKMVLGIYALILIVPISGTQYIDTISMLKIGSVNVLELAVIFLFVFGILSGNLLVMRKDWLNILAMCLMGVYFIGLFINLDKARCVSDTKDYIIPFLLFFCMRAALYGENSFEIFIETTLKALRINAIIILIGYFLYWLPSGFIGRYGFGCESLYVFSIPVQVYFGTCKHARKEKIRDIVGAALQIFLVLISQTRSLILCLIFILGLYLVVSFFKRNTVYGFIRKMGLIAVVIIVGVVGYNYLLKATSLSGWMYRMSELFSSGVETKSNMIRFALIEYYIPQILAKPFGHGFGVTMSAFDFTSVDTLSLVSGEALAIDNLLITYMYKLGIIPGIIYIAIHVIAFSKLLKTQMKIDGLTIIKIALLVVVVPTVFMSVQALKYLAIACFFWGFIAVSPTMTNKKVSTGSD